MNGGSEGLPGACRGFIRGLNETRRTWGNDKNTQGGFPVIWEGFPFLCFVLLKNIFSNIDFSFCVVYAEKANVQGILPRKESQTDDSNTEKKHGNT